MSLRQPHERISHSLKFTYKKTERLPFREVAPLFIFYGELAAAPFDKFGFRALRRIVTDEGSPPWAGLTAARTFVILWLAAGAASAPSEGFGFRAPPVADAARKASRCRPQVRERTAEARAANGEGAKLARPKDTKARLRER